MRSIRSMHGWRRAGGNSGLAGTSTLASAIWLSVLIGGAGLSAGCEDPIERSRPTLEVIQNTVKLELPEVPAFDIPGRHPDGTHTVREMRLQSAKLLNSEVRIKGFVTWMYDCVSELQRSDETATETSKRIDEDPTVCQRPHFFIGDSADTSGERSIWVVDVPRKPRADELKVMGRSERQALPKPPKVALGDEVILTGVWQQESPKGFSNSQGLLVYKSLENVGEN